MADKNTMQAILDKAQVEAAQYFGERENIVEYCNACINSGVGALASHYGDNSPMADVAVLTVLSVWVETVQKRVKSAQKQPARH